MSDLVPECPTRSYGDEADSVFRLSLLEKLVLASSSVVFGTRMLLCTLDSFGDKGKRVPCKASPLVALSLEHSLTTQPTQQAIISNACAEL